MTGKYTDYVRKVHNNFFNSQWWKNIAWPFILNKFLNRVSKLVYSSEAPKCHVMREDWDNLIVLDACRFDQFDRINTIPGETEARTSLGSTTQEWLEQNFQSDTYHDTVCVTANPQYSISKISADVFHNIIHVWENNWDEQYNTVLPENMVNSVVEASNDYPNKRIIAHFVQPHYPFIGESAKRIGDHAGGEFSYKKARGHSTPDREAPTVWQLLEEGEIDEENVWEAYDENLEIVLNSLQDLLPELTGKTVITSDHGNVVGEKIHILSGPQFGHPRGAWAKPLRKVPWHIVQAQERKTVQHGPPEGSEHASDVVTDRLADLGYFETDK